MPVSLGLSITQNSQNSTTKTTNVTVALTIYWTGSSYNGYSKPGTVTIDGTPYDFTASFNYANGKGPVSASGNVVAFTKTLNIPHNSDGTKTLYCSATYESGVSSGTVTTSNSKVLTPFEVSPGGNTGGNTGGDSGGNTGGSGSGSSGGTPTDPADIISHPDTNCTYLGSRNANDDYYGNNGFSTTASATLTFHYGFITPADLETSTSVTFQLPVTQFNLNNEVNWFFSVTLEEVSSYNSIGYAPINASSSNYSCTITTDKLKPNTEYRLRVHLDSYPNGSAYAVVSYPPLIYIDYVAIGASTTNTVNIDTGSEFAPYEIYIDNGSGWDKYAAYIDDGTSWHLYS